VALDGSSLHRTGFVSGTFGHLQNLPTIVRLKGHRAISPKVKKNHPFSCSRFASLESHVAGDLKPKAVVPGCCSQALSRQGVVLAPGMLDTPPT